MKLDTVKIERMLTALDRNKAWLARKAGVSRPLVYYWLKSKSVVGADRLGKAFGIDPKDLIK